MENIQESKILLYMFKSISWFYVYMNGMYVCECADIEPYMAGITKNFSITMAMQKETESRVYNCSN